MEVSPEKFNALEKEVAGVKKTLTEDILPLLQKIDRGLYGEKENEAEGLIKAQKNLQLEVENLKKEIKAIHKKNADQDLIIGTEKKVIGKGKDLLKSIGQIIVTAAVVLGILAGVLGVDALLK